MASFPEARRPRVVCRWAIEVHARPGDTGSSGMTDRPRTCQNRNGERRGSLHSPAVLHVPLRAFRAAARLARLLPEIELSDLVGEDRIGRAVPPARPEKQLGILHHDAGKPTSAPAPVGQTWRVYLPELQPLTGFPVSLGAWFGQDLPPAALPYFPSRFSPRTPMRAGPRVVDPFGTVVRSLRERMALAERVHYRKGPSTGPAICLGPPSSMSMLAG